MRISIAARMRADRAGTVPIYVRLEHGGNTQYVPLGIRVPKGEWNQRKGEVRATNYHADEINGVLAQRLATARSAALRVQARTRHFTALDVREAIEDALHPKPEPVRLELDFVAYARAALEAYEARGQVATAYAYGSGVGALEAFMERQGYASGGALPFDAITPPFVRAFEADLKGRQGKKPNTIHKYVSGLRTIMRQAVRDEVSGAASALRALEAVKLRKEKGEKVRLPIEAVRRMAEMEAAGRVADVRDWFVFSFFVGGMRFSDVCLLRWEHVDTASSPWHVRWRQKKTREGQSLPAIGPAQAILERWRERTGPGGGAGASPFVFGLVTEAEASDPKALRSRVDSWNALARKNLAKICDRLEIPRVTPHAARHSIADYLRKSGMSLYDISKVLGHANLRVTEAYLSGFDRDDLDAKLTRLLGSPPDS